MTDKKNPEGQVSSQTCLNQRTKKKDQQETNAAQKENAEKIDSECYG